MNLAIEASGVKLADSEDYDRIFAALKNPIRRQILLILEQKGEVSFTNLQQTIGISDTGQMSYHLKELATLVEQSEKGKYRLSQTGEAGVALFQKVETQRNRTSVAVHRELEKTVGKIFFFFAIFAVACAIPASVDITLAVRSVLLEPMMGQLASFSLLGFLGLVLCVILFTFYDRHYFSRKIKTNVLHSMVFAVLVSVLSFLTFYSVYSFSLTFANPGGSIVNGTLMLWVFILRTTVFLASVPFLTYAISRFLNRRLQR